MSTQTVKPVLPVAPYLGGKRNLSKRLVAMIDQVDHTTYCEPFVGMGGVFLRRIRPPKAEVINDINRELATFYRILQRHYVPFMEMMRFQITTRAEFERLVKTDQTTLTDLERAARFLYLQRTAFGGKVSGRNFGVSLDRGGRFDITKLGPMLDDLHTRLAGVVIECLPYGDFIRRYDRPGTLFYLDPPYWGGENDYGKNIFARDDFEKLSELLRGLSGRFIMSLNDVPAVRDIFAGFDIQSVDVSYSVARKAKTEQSYREVIISKI